MSKGVLLPSRVNQRYWATTDLFVTGCDITKIEDVFINLESTSRDVTFPQKWWFQ